VLLGAVLLFTGTAHLTFGRQGFRAQVPSWVPLPTDFVVVASGVVELLLGIALIVAWRTPAREVVGWIVAAFFVAIFPGNVSQLVTHTSAFGLDTDTSRAVRLVFQPVLVLWALWSTWAWWSLRRRRRAPRRDDDAAPGS
jgi:uncharacterized membrane protein